MRANYGTGGDPAARGLRPVVSPAQTVTSKVGRCFWMNGTEQQTREQPKASGRRVTVQEAAVLQSFPADYPWKGTATAQYRQVGDSVPPVLAASILECLMGSTHNTVLDSSCAVY
jgi:DNA (cytosine-5)-methyltransferase 1